MSKASNPSRRALLRGAVVTSAAALAAPAAMAQADDSALLARVAEFDKLYGEHVAASERSHAIREAADNDPACPWHDLTVNDPAGYARWDAFMASRGCWAAYHAASGVLQRCGELARAIFATPAATAPGILAKLRIVELAYGSGPDIADNDVDLHAFQEDESWLGSVLADLERLAKISG